MKVYLHISKSLLKKSIHRDLISILRENLSQDMDIVDNLADSDIVYIFGAWRMQDAIFARKVRQMGIPYILIPLGHISRWNIEHYLIKRIIQSVLYQKLLAKKAGCIITTSKLEDTYLKKLKWNQNIIYVTNCLYSQVTTNSETANEIWQCGNKILTSFTQEKEEKIHKITDDEIIYQILLIKNRMPHQNIPFQMVDQLHCLLKNTEYNDDELEEKIEKMKLKKFSESLFAVTMEKTGLTEGFIPFPQKVNKLSKKINKYIKF